MGIVMIRIRWKVLLCCLLVVLASCAAGKQTGKAAGQGFNNGVCTSEYEWGGFIFDVELRQADKGMLNVRIDMSRTKWDSGVVEAWLQSGGKKILPVQASKGAVTEHASINIPAIIGGSGIIFDSIRNRKVGGNSHTASAVTGGVALGVDVANTEIRKSQFDPETTVWTGLFPAQIAADCSANLWVRYWMPEGGLAGRRSVPVGHCFCR